MVSILWCSFVLLAWVMLCLLLLVCLCDYVIAGFVVCSCLWVCFSRYWYFDFVWFGLRLGGACYLDLVLLFGLFVLLLCELVCWRLFDCVVCLFVIWCCFACFMVL